MHEKKVRLQVRRTDSSTWNIGLLRSYDGTRSFEVKQSLSAFWLGLVFWECRVLGGRSRAVDREGRVAPYGGCSAKKEP